MKDIRSTNAFFLFTNVIFILGASLLPALGDGGQFLFLLLLPVLYVKYYRQENVKKRMMINPIGIKSIGILTLITLISIPITSFLLNLSVMGVGNQMDFLFKEELQKPILFLMFSLAVVPAICEEAFMRGVILTGHKDMKWVHRILFNGVLFGIFHLNVNQFSYALFLGLSFSLAVLITRSIWASVWMHFVNNGVSVVISKFFEDDKTASAAVSMQEMLILGVASVIAVAAMVYLFNLLSRNLHGESFAKYLNHKDQEESLVEQEHLELIHQRDTELAEAQQLISVIQGQGSDVGVAAIKPLHPIATEETYKKKKMTSALTWHIYVMLVLFGLFSAMVVYMAQNPEMFG